MYTSLQKEIKKGKSFGFIKFKDIHTVKEMETRLSQVWIGSFKLIVNLQRFERNQPKGYENTHKNSSALKQGVTYPEAVVEGRPKGKNYHHRRGDNRSREIIEKGAINPSEDEWNKESYVGITFKLEHAYDMQKKLHSVGIFSVKAAPLGGNMVLLTKEVDVDLLFVLNEASSPLSKWFEETRPWDSHFLVKERVVCLKLTGVLAHAFNEDFCF